MLVTQDVPSLLGGITQQPPTVRSPDQLETAHNTWSSLSQGLLRRPPTEHVATLSGVPSGPVYWHEIERDGEEAYLVLAAGGVLRVFDLAGVEIPVTAPGGWGYLSGITDWEDQIHMVTVKDFTFVVNRTKTVAMDASPAADQIQDPAYYLWINPSIGQDRDADIFGPGLPYQYAPNASAAGGLAGQVQSFDKLPATAPEGAIYEITGSAETGFTSYYVRRTGAVWDETVRPGLRNALDATTMPHALVRQPNGSFVFAPFSWAPRQIGDEATNPNPTFVGRVINAVFLYQNRLAFLSDDSVVMSASGEPGRFFRATVLDLLDADPVSIAATTSKVSVLRLAMPYNEGVLISSDQQQFALTNGEVGVTVTSVAMRPTTNYAVSARGGMAGLGSEVYFAVEPPGAPGSGWAAIREYSRLANEDATSAALVTAHVPNLIPSGVRRIVPMVDQNAVAVYSAGAPSQLFVYQVYWTGPAEKAQSAWQTWDFGPDAVIASMAFIRSALYVIVRRGLSVFIEKVDLTEGAVGPGLDHQAYLDRRVDLQGVGVFLPETNRTRFVVPYAATSAPAPFTLVRPNMTAIITTPSQWVNATTVEVPGDERGVVCGGIPFETRIELSPVYLRREGNVPVTQGRTQIRTVVFTLRNTAYMTVEVAPYGVEFSNQSVLPGKLREFTGKVLGKQNLLVEQPVFYDGPVPFQVYGYSPVSRVAVSNDSHVGLNITALSYELFHHRRGR